MKFIDAAYRILRDEKRPLSLKEITTKAFAEGLITSEGKTPDATMAAEIYGDIQKEGDKSLFIKVDKGVFGLREWSKKEIEVSHKAKQTTTGAQSIIDLLVSTQYKSDSPSDFENSIKEAFSILGFEAELIGGAGDTDVILTANIGQESFKVSVDGKTSKTGKIIDRQIDWISLEDHRRKNKADFIVVIGADFAGGNLSSRADQYNVSLLMTDELIKILNAHAQFPFTLLELKDLFAGKGNISPHLEDLLSQNLSRRVLLERFRVVIEEMQALQDRLGYFTYDSLAGREKLEGLEIEPKDIDYIIKLMMLPFINGLQEISAGKYILTMGIGDIANIFKQISILLVNEEEIEEVIEAIPVTESKQIVKDIKPERKLGSKYFTWYISGHSIVAEARKENPYKHHCPIEHFETILRIIEEAYKHQNLISADLIFSMLQGKELSPNRLFKGKPEDYKIRMTLGILEIEGLIKWTGSKRPIEYMMDVQLENVEEWLTKQVAKADSKSI